MEQFAADVKQYQRGKAERETGGVVNMEVVNPMKLIWVAESELQYGAEVFGVHKKEAEKSMTNKNNVTGNVSRKAVKADNERFS